MITKATVATLIVISIVFVCAYEDVPIKIGAIFDTSNKYKEIAFEVAIQELNYKKFIHNGNSKIESAIERLSSDDPLGAMKATCSLMQQGVVAILAPSLENNFKVVQSICDEKDVALFDIRWVDEPGISVTNFYPSQFELTQLYIDVINLWEFKDFVILYDNVESFRRISRFLELYDNKNHQVILRQLDQLNNGDYRPVLKEVRKSGVKYLMLDCSIEILEEILLQAQQVGLMSDKYYFFITNLDLHTLNLIPYQYSETNITGLRIFDPWSDSIRYLATQIFKEEIEETSLHDSLRAAWKLRLETVLVVDAVMMFGDIINESPEIRIPIPISCEENDRWVAGSSVTNVIKGKGKYTGFSGVIEFSGKGYRTNFGVEVMELKEGGFTIVGNWSKEQKFISKRIYDKPREDNKKSLRHQTFRVVICLTPPFAMYTPSLTILSGNDRYQGYAIDLIEELSKKEGFTYYFIEQDDKKNGDFNKNTGKWEGMIGRILNNEADLAIADLTINSPRQNVVDFTTPFMNLGISILYQKPRKAAPSFFSFADPFAPEVWALVALSYLTVAIVLFILGRICASEWTNPYPCIEEPDYLENQLSLRNCFWFVSGSIMQQGTDIGPLGLSTRVLAGAWWFFTLIMVSSYTANLAVFLTRETPIPHFNDVFELVANAKERNIKWGAKQGGSTVEFFNMARDRYPEYGHIYDVMTAKGSNLLVTENKFGVERAQKENYAFFMEITSIEYEIQTRCDLVAVGKLLDEKSYGIAMRKNSTYRSALSRAILELQHSGKLNELKRKWWEEKQGGGSCKSNDDQSEATALTLKNVGGVFWVTIGGVLIAILLVVAEMVLHVVKVSILTKAPLKKSIVEEFKFYFKFSGMVKPASYGNSNDEGPVVNHEKKI